MDEYTTIREEDRDEWHIEIALAPDYDYRPGYDDDIYPRFESVSGWYDEDERDEDGRFVPQPIIVDSRHDRAMVTVDEIARIREITGCTRAQIESDARAIAGEELSWSIVRVTATAPSGATGTDYLGGVEYDLRERDPERYALETVEEAGMIEEAIEEAARSVLGRGNAVLALSY